MEIKWSCRLLVKNVICLPKKDLEPEKNTLESVRVFQIELQFDGVGFWREGRAEAPVEKPLISRSQVLIHSDGTSAFFDLQ